MVSRLHPLAACVVAALSCTNVDLSTAGQLELVVAGSPTSLGSPAAVEFEAAAALPGETLSATIELANVAANGVLTVRSVTLDGAAELAIEAPPLPLSLAHAERVAVTIRYTRPAEDSRPAATVTIETDTVSDAEKRVVVPVLVSDAYPVADVPAVLDFGLVRPGDTSERSVVIRNTSSVTLRIVSADLDAGPFRLVPDQTLPPEIRIPPQGSWPLRIEAAPTTGDPLEVVLPVVTNEAAATGQHPVRLTANVNIAAIAADGVDFGVSYGVRTSPLVIRSEGAVPLEITAIRVGAGSDPALSLAGDLPTPESPWTVQSGHEVAVTVALDTSNADNTAIAGTVEIDSNALAATTVVPFSAVRASQSAPVPVITLEQGASLAPPGTAIRLSGKASYTVQESTKITGYTWSLLESPAGAAPLDGDLSAPYLELTPWTAGRYVVGLSVRDSLGQTATSPAEQVLDIRPSEALWAELTWEATDAGGAPIAADLDLHLVRLEPEDSAPGWFCGSRDCYFDVTASDWGASGFAGDDPTFHSTSGSGPEVISIVSPADGDYALGVYWDSPSPPLAEGAQVTATVRVLRLGELIGTFTADWPLVSESGVLWDAARVTATSGATAAAAIAPLSIIERGLACESN